MLPPLQQQISTIELLTITSDRPQCLKLCSIFVTRMVETFEKMWDLTYPCSKHPGVCWTIVSDGKELASVKSPVPYAITHRPPSSNSGISFRENLRAGLKNLRSGLTTIKQREHADVVLFIEDDDWYHPYYLWYMYHGLLRSEIFGEGRALYYAPSTARYRIWDNRSHASLCSTGIRSTVISSLLTQLDWLVFVDQPLWKNLDFIRHLDVPEARTNPMLERRFCVGMKGLPGKRGFTDAHDARTTLDHYDSEYKLLRNLIGEEDFRLYYSGEFFS